MLKDNDGLLRVFWPNNLARATTPGVIVGWRNSSLDLFVITILEDVEARNVETALRTETLFRGANFPVRRIFEICDRMSMHVLGNFNHGDISSPFDASKIQVYRAAGDSKPRVYCPTSTKLSVQIILYDPPDPAQLQYISLEPINLALVNKSLRESSETDGEDEIEAEDEHERRRLQSLVKKLKFHSVVRRKPTQQEVALPTILRQINCVVEIAALLQKNTPFVGPRRKREISVSERVVESAQSLYTFAAWSFWSLFMAYAYPILSYTLRLTILCHRAAAEIVLQCLEFRLPIRRMTLPDSTGVGTKRLSLKDVSACCQQVHLRLQQFSYYPTQYIVLRKRHSTWSSTAGANADYIRFYNSLWLVANDVIIGIALGSFISENADATAKLMIEVVDQWTIEGLRGMIKWLMSYPGGLKLNTELAAFLGDLFLWVIEYWSGTTKLLVSPYLPTIVYVIGFSSFAGASMPIAIFSDLLSLLTIHIYSFYIASARIFNWQLTIIVSLFHLFRGKKRNVLRNRIDNCDYDLDQLLLGTILFTLLFFLLPTVIVFYLTFASARMAIITLKATLDTCLACLNHFPLFALMLKIKDSRRLPGGVHFELLPSNSAMETVNIETSSKDENEDDTIEEISEDQDQDLFETDSRHAESCKVSYIKLSSTSLSVRQIFAQYFQLGGRIRKHYLSPTVAFRLVTGRFVPPLGRGEMYGMQYSVLPRKRASLSEVWSALFEKNSELNGTAIHNGNVFKGRHDVWNSPSPNSEKRWK